ncbi:hypothetical protein [Ralstonia insidiosa]|jgi:hypothetical protein|nr:hypothetical protein [Ralstonia insidiosa]MBA9939343.1 hypothetical protein [Ralstonia insidiosa]MBC9968113.1 hypothetical protein [Ralstonia insidiosa]MBX3904324.1 hypothetical protein [Ralstonia insidiosa]
MINLQHPLSPTLAALLLKELPREFFTDPRNHFALDTVGEQAAMNRFYSGLEEHRLDIRSEPDSVEFCDAALAYLDAILDPEWDVSEESAIEIVSGTSLWSHMTDVQRTVLHQEAATLHALITPVLWRNSLMNPTNQQ